MKDASVTMKLEFWKIFAECGLPGLALAVFLILCLQVAKNHGFLPRNWVGPINFLMIIAIVGVVSLTIIVGSKHKTTTSSHKQENDHNDLKIYSSALVSLQELRTNSEELKKYRYNIKNGNKNDRPHISISTDITKNTIREIYPTIVESAYGEENNLFIILMIISRFDENLTNIKTFSDLEEWNERSEINMLDISFLNCFLAWYIYHTVEYRKKNTLMDPEIWASCVFSNSDFKDMKYITNSKDEILIYSDYLGIVD